MAFDLYKMLHVLGVVVLLGNVTITSFWKVFADRTGDARIIAQAQRMVSLTDWVFTLAGILLLIIGGFGAASEAGIAPFAEGWLRQAEILFLLSGGIWLFVLVPIQIRQSRQARAFAEGGAIPETYRRDGRLWLIWGIAATIPLIAAMWLMVAKG